jgi:acetyl esterase/lipase
MVRFAVLVLVSIVLATPEARQSSATVERDLAYGTDPTQRLDLSVPAGKGFPTVIFVHGGSLTGGDKADADYGRVCDAFPAAGIACANVNYRLLSSAPWPAPAEDVAAAIAWLREKLPARGGNPQKLFLLGHSSGALLVALVGSDERFLKQRNLTTGALSGVMPMGSIMWDDDLRQAIERNGREKIESAFARDPRGKAFGSLEAYEAQWPINYVRPGLPPFLFLIAESEQINPPILRTNQQFVDTARVRGSQADLRVFAGRTHYSNIRKIHEAGDEVFSAVVAFVRPRSARTIDDRRWTIVDQGLILIFLITGGVTGELFSPPSCFVSTAASASTTSMPFDT